MAQVDKRTLLVAFVTIISILLTPVASTPCLPRLLIIGTQKAGTTFLGAMLNQHPNLTTPRYEIHYFDKKKTPPTAAEYRTLFDCEDGQVSFDKTPMYLFCRGCPKKVKEVVPHARFVVLLRQPIARFVSSVKMDCSAYRLRNLEVLNNMNIKDIREAENCVYAKTLPDAIRLCPWKVSRLARGCYAESLLNWFNYFPRDQFLILNFEDLVRDPQRVGNQILEHIGLSANFTFPLQTAYNHQRPKPLRSECSNLHVGNKTRAMMEGFYHPCMRRLEDLLLNVSSWHPWEHWWSV